MTAEPEPRERATLEALLEFVKSSRGFDFTGYKRSSIERRVGKRMAEVGTETYEDYIDYLELHAEEFPELFNMILINVTSFFRDPAAWEYITNETIPSLIGHRGRDPSLRVWCAGCASGEEAYTVAMCFARVLGDDAFRERVKIYATDVDEAALDQARHGAYLPRQIEPVPAEDLERFFERTDQRYVFRKDLRRSVIFGRNDLVQDAPISKIDLLLCRNTLMYFTAETQAQILRRFHFALGPQGFLMLGKSEMLITHSELFTPAEVKQRVFRKVLRAPLRERARAVAGDFGGGISPTISGDLREAAFDIAGPAQIVIDPERTVMMINDSARRLFGLGSNDLGRPLQDLEVSYRPLELRGHLDAVEGTAQPIDIKGIRWHRGDQERIVDVRLAPLAGEDDQLGASVTYRDVTEEQELQEQLSRSKRELEQAYEELNSTVEELETTNEELQSTNEELETTNEELQSTNEELETMNEELQSTNEELETMNDELRNRTLELNDINAFLETILTTIGFAVVVVDRSHHVRIWNSQARELWGLTSDEVEDEHLFSLDIGLPMEKLRSALRTVLADNSAREELTVQATNRRGKGFECHVTVLPLAPASIDGVPGAIIMMEPA
jgi:two-component system, chemotaxis family, CheB/CheR fusion protein